MISSIASGQVAAERVRISLHWGISSKVLLEAYEKVIWSGLPLSAKSKSASKDIAEKRIREAASLDEG